MCVSEIDVFDEVALVCKDGGRMSDPRRRISLDME